MFQGWAADRAQLHQQAQTHVLKALAPSLANTHPSVQTWHFAFSGHRGGAAQTCPTDWTWPTGQLDLTHWRRLHVPVLCGAQRGSLVVQINAHAMLWSAARDLPRGHVLQAHDVTQQLQPVTHAQALLPWSSLEGLKLREPVTVGTALRLAHTERPIYAQKGQTVELRASHQGISVSVEAVIPKSARKDETVRVRNVRSQQWVQGILVAPGIVEASPLLPGEGAVKVVLESTD